MRNSVSQGAFYCQKLGGNVSDNQQIVDASAAIAASKAATYAGSGVAGISAWMGTIDWGFWISISVAMGGFLMNWYFAKKKDKRDEIEHKAYLGSLEGKCDAKQD